MKGKSKRCKYVMAATSSMCFRTMCGLSRVVRSCTGIRLLRIESARMSTTVANGKPADAEGEAGSGPNTEQMKEPASIEKLLIEEKIKLQEDINELKDKYIRSLAETENVRQRMQKQVDDAKLYGIQGFCKDLLEVADILHTATLSVPQDQLPVNPPLKDLFDGLTMTETQLQKVFSKHGLLQILPVEGDKFDPNVHEALFQVPSAVKEEETIAIVQKIGYKLHDRTIRPALVGVFKTP